MIIDRLRRIEETISKKELYETSKDFDKICKKMRYMTLKNRIIFYFIL